MCYNCILQATFVVCKGFTQLVNISSYQTDNQDSVVGLISFTSNLCDSMTSNARLYSQVPNILSINSRKVRLSMLSSTRSHEAPFSKIPPITEPVQEWDTIESDIFLFYACQLNSLSLSPCKWLRNYIQVVLIVYLISYITYAGSRLGDGIFHIFLFRKPASAMDTAYLIKSIQNGEHIHNNEYCQTFTCVAYRLEVSSCSFEGERCGLLDHYPIKFSSIQGEILPNRSRMFCGKIPLALNGYFIG